MLYKVAVNTEFTNPDLLLQGKYRMRFLRASGYNFYTNQSIPNRVLCVFLLKTPYLTYTVDSLTLDSRPRTRLTAHAWMELHQHTCFLRKAHQRYTRQPFVQRGETRGLHRPWRGPCVECESQTRRQTARGSAPAGCARRWVTKPDHSAHVHEWLWECLSAAFGVTSKCQQQVNWHIRNPQIMRGDFTSLSNVLKENKPLFSTPLVSPASC